MRSSNRPRLAIVAPALLTLASCGGSSSTTTMAQYISEANAICTSSSASSAAVPQPSVAGSLISPGPKDLPAIATYLGNQISVLQSTIARLKALGAPPSKGTAWNQGIAAIQSSVNDAKAAQAGAQAGNVAAYKQALSRVVQDGTSIDQGFGSVGASACTSTSAGPSTPSPSR